ncbi:MAG: alpha-amylase family protein [Armatimonadota bacterium]
MTLAAANLVREADKLCVRWDNGAHITFALEGDFLLGIRDVTMHGVPLRNAAKLWRPLIITPQGIHYRQFRLEKVNDEADGTVRVITTAVGIQTLLQEELDEYLGDVLHLPPSDDPVYDQFVWELRPGALDLDGRLFAGFSYRYHFISQTQHIYRIFDDATWEIGGQVEGNTLLLQGQVNPPVTVLHKSDYFTTACNYYGAEMRGMMGKPNRVSIQRLPRIGTLQAFDYLQHAQGILFNYFDPVSEVFTIVQKDIDEDQLHIVDELRCPLSGDFITYPKHILFHQQAALSSTEEMHNGWKSAYDFVYERERTRANITPSPVLPRIWIPQVSTDIADFPDADVPRPEVLDYLAERVLPQWAEMGVKEICMHSLWNSDYTVDRLRTKEEGGMHGGLVVGSICNVRDRVIDPLWGGVEAVARFTERAHALGVQVQLWWATHLSLRAQIYAERPDFMLLSRDGLPNGGGYGHQCIITMDLANPDCFDWEFSRLKAVYEATGIDGFFHDSYGNMTFLPVNYAEPQRTGQQEAYERLVRQLQAVGLKTFTIEGLGPFGVGHFGMNLLPKASTKGGYQNALDWWVGHEAMTAGLNMGIGQQLWPGQEAQAQEFSFRCLATGGRFAFTQHDGMLEMWSGWLREQNQIHAQLAPITGKRILLPEDRGVYWQQEDGRALLFSYRAFAYNLPAGRAMYEVTPSGEVKVSQGNTAMLTAPWAVYRIV